MRFTLSTFSQGTAQTVAELVVEYSTFCHMDVLSAKSEQNENLPAAAVKKAAKPKSKNSA